MDDIAVVGIACRFPGGASDPQKFWELLSNKRSGFCQTPESRYNVKAFHHEAREKLNTLSASGAHFLEQDISAFDAPFFSITAQEAAAMDPTARLLLEVTYEALENAGLPIESLAGSNTSCYVGCFTRDWHEMLMRDPETAPMYSGSGTGFSLLSNRVSWFYDLHGPSMTLDTACSSSLVGLHMACQGLRSGESSVALVSGANMIFSPDLPMWLSNLRMTSIDGLSRSFADGVTGYGRGEGIGTLVLKTVRDALRDGDSIRAVIRGTGVNQDGHTTGITVPSREAQADLIRSTYRSAGLDVSQTSYFEAHGTGTEVGDPLELGAVAQAISAARPADDPLYVGSVKSNIGHLEGAAGLAGVIKCVLMLEKGAILPNIHFDRPNKRIPFNDWKIHVPTEVTPWPSHRMPRASVSSFGYGGTNAHVIIDTADQLQVTTTTTTMENGDVIEQGQTKLFILSAPAESALRRMVERTRGYLLEVESNNNNNNPNNTTNTAEYLDRLAFTYSDRRSQFPWKAMVVADTLSELAEGLSTASTIAHSSKKPRIAFVFTGQGAQWARMGLELWIYAVFRESVQEADSYLTTHLGSNWSVITELEKDASTSSIGRAHISQPLCTVLQIALVDLLKSWNIEPTAVVGHSSGEVAAAYCCGALSRQDAWTVAYHRGKSCLDRNADSAQVKGSMMAVGLSAEEAQEYVRDVKAGVVVVACINSPSSVTISGDETGIDELQATLTDKGVFARKVQVENAYHSHHMKQVAGAYLQQISSIQTKEAPSENAVYMVSSVTGKLVQNDQLGPDYWVQNFVSPVLFTDAVSTLLQDPTRRRRRARAGESAFDVLLEIGPHSALKGPLRQILQQQGISTVTYASMLLRKENAVRSAIRAAGELSIRGAPVNIPRVNRITSKPRPLVDLPSYPFDHSLKYWAESRISWNYRFRRFGRHDLLGAPVADASVNQPRWRNILRVQEQPWLRDHAVHSSILYPASGSLVMVLEAVRQLAAAGIERQIESIKLENVRITKAIVVPNDQTGIETVLQLQRDDNEEESDELLQESWQFFVFSCSDGATLDQNSSGRVTVRYTPGAKAEKKEPETAAWTTGKKLAWQAATEEYKAATEKCNQPVDPTEFYTVTQDAGLQYGPQFQGLVDIKTGSNACVNVVNVTDTKTPMPGAVQSPHLIHPSTLDVILHSMFSAIGDEGLDFKTAAVPIAFDSLLFYTDIPSSPGSQFRVCCNTKRDGSRHLLADICVSDMDWKEPKIIVKGIRCRELPAGDSGNSSRSASAKAPVGTLVWKPDITLLDEAQLNSYISEALAKSSTDKPPSWEAEVQVVVDLAAHNNPDLSILQIGHSDSLVNSVLSVVGSPDPAKTIRCLKYTILDPDQDQLTRCADEFHQWSNIVSFGNLDLAHLGEKEDEEKKESLDMIIVNSDLITAEHVRRLKTLLHPEGIMVLQKPRTKDSEAPYVNGQVNGHVETHPSATTWSILNCSPTSSWVLGRKEKTTAESTDQTITLIEPKIPTPRVTEVSRQLSTALNAMGGVRTETVQWSAEEAFGLQGKTLISLLELESAFLRDISVDDYTALKAVVLNSARLLWVTMGNMPVMQAAIGYLRVAQNENTTLDLRYLLVEESSEGRSAQDISSVIAPIAIAPTTNREYMEVGGRVHINRWVNDDNLSGVIDTATNGSLKDPVSIPLAASKVPLRLLHSQTESPKPQIVYGAVDQEWRDDLVADEVEVQVKAIGLNSQDYSSENVSAVEFSGIITKTGESCSRLKQGDRVWGLVAASAYQTFFRVKEYLCQLVPPTATFEEAASWPLCLSTAYAALIDTAHLQQGQTILIQAASSAIGQFAIQLALRAQARVLATVSGVEEQREEIEKLGVGAEYILNSNDPDLAVAISGLTHGKGPDVILNQSSSGKTLQSLWTSIAASGTFIDINISEDGGDSGLSIAPMRRGASYTVFNFGKTLQEDPSQVAKILGNVSELNLSKAAFRQPTPQTTWKASQAADAIKWDRSQTDHHGKAVLSFGDCEDKIPVTPEVANPLDIDANGTYLLVGGTSGLGANMAVFLAQKGARHLAMISRSGPAAKNAESFTQSLKSMGVVNVKLYAADVSDETAMRQVLEQCAAEMPRIRGVIQGAVVLNDSAYHNMTHDQWRNSTRPKIHGSWLLHQLLPRDLQFFIMLSSIAGVVGNRGQANYAAGNTYQDALAHYRRTQGLSAVSIDLGLMLDIGFIAERGGDSNLRKWEVVGIHEDEFHLIMTAAIAGSWNSSPLPTQVICGLVTGGILESMGLQRPFYIADRRFAYLRKHGLDPNKNKQDAIDSESVLISSQLAKVQSRHEATELIVAGLSQRLATDLQTAVEDIDSSRPLHSYGVDSLLAVDIRTWIIADLQAELSLFDVLGSASIYALASRVATISKAVPEDVQ